MWYSDNIPPRKVPIERHGFGRPNDGDDPGNGNGNGNGNGQGADGPTGSQEHGAAFAHEMNNLLDGSLRNVSLVLSRLDAAAGQPGPPVDDVVQRLRTAREAMTHMAGLLHQWLRGDEKLPLLKPPPRPTSVDDAIEDALRLIEPMMRERRIAVDTVMPGAVARAPIGPLEPVIANVLRNAVEALGDGGRIEIHGERNGGELVLHISDDGPGFAASLPRDADGQPVPGATTKPSGHGLGLAICRRIIDSIGGWFEIDTEPGAGTTLTIRWRERAVDELPSLHDLDIR